MKTLQEKGFDLFPPRTPLLLAFVSSGLVQGEVRTEGSTLATHEASAAVGEQGALAAWGKGLMCLLGFATAVVAMQIANLSLWSGIDSSS